MRGPPLSYIPHRRTHSKYAAPWTSERVGRYSHSYITSYKLNFSSSPLFKPLQYFPSRFPEIVPESKVFVRVFARRSFLRTIWLKVLNYVWRIGNTSTHMAFPVSSEKQGDHVCPMKYYSLFNPMYTETTPMRTRGFSANVGCIFVNVKFPRCFPLCISRPKKM